MSDPLTTHEVPAADTLAGRDRDARVEQLLLAGLDQYFGGQYEQAVYLWTRVLFLDRGHARARAYIDRARSALAERQRQSDELLHRGTAAFEQGESTAARQLLTAAVDGGAAEDVALGYLGRLDRLERYAMPAGPAAPMPPTETRPSATDAPAPGRRIAGGAAVVVVLSAFGAGLWWSGAVDDLGPWRVTGRPAAAAPSPADPITVPQATDRTLARARDLFGTGHVREAMHEIAAIPPADPNRAAADRLLADIQRTLLTTADPSAAVTMSTVQ